MGLFELVVTLLSFVYALALTHLLQSATDLVLVRERVRFSLVHAIWMVIAVVLLFGNWLTLWGMRETPMTRPIVLMEFAFAISQYFFASLMAPRIPEEGPVDMMQTHVSHGRIYALAGALVAAIDFIRMPYYTTGGDTRVGQGADIFIVALLLIVAWRREKRVQLVGTILLGLVMMVFFLIG